MSEKIVQLNEEVIKGLLKELVRGSVEETLNGLLEAEAEKGTVSTGFSLYTQPAAKKNSGIWKEYSQLKIVRLE